jgi:hypothetical protein
VFDLMGLAMLLAATLISLSLGGMPEPAEPAAGPPAGNAVALEHNTPAPANEAPPRAMSLDQIRRYGTVMAAVGLVGLAGIVLLAAAPGAMLKVGHFVLTPLPEAWRLTIMEFVESLISPMRFVRSPTRVGLGLLLTLLVWSATALATWLLSFGFGLRLSLSAVLVIQLAISVAVALPQAPSFLGLFQVGALTAARFYGIPNGEAAAFANVLWAVNVVPITVVGLIVLHAEGLSLRKLAHESEEAAEHLEEEHPQEDMQTPTE